MNPYLRLEHATSTWVRRALVEGVGEIPSATFGWIRQHPRVCGDVVKRIFSLSNSFGINVGFTWHC